jgi:hypothetical protein
VPHVGKSRLVKKRRFSASLDRYPGKGGWTFARIPREATPPVTRGWGRTPVRATVDGQSWDTSVWRSKNGESMIPVPKHIRGTKEPGETVHIQIAFDPED